METKNMARIELFELKRKLLIGVLAIRMFISGVEYSVILPTALLYIKTFDSSDLFLGVVVGIYPAAAMLSLPLCGYVYDKTRRFKELLIALNMCQVVGNILYSLSFSKWLPVSGRFIGGLGDGVISIATGEITYLYSPESRLRILAVLEIGRVFGFLMGPLINTFISTERFVIDMWILDKTTLPGVIMASAWFIYNLLVLCCVFNTAKEAEETMIMEEKKQLLTEQSKVDVTVQTTNDFSDESLIYTDNFNDDEVESTSSENSDTSESSDSNFAFDHMDKSVKPNLSRKKYLDNYWLNSLRACFSVEFMVIIYCDLVLWAIQTQYEVLMPYITEFEFGWTPVTASYVYVGGGCVILSVFIMIFIFSTKFPIRDSFLLLFALILTQISLGGLILEDNTNDLFTRMVIFFTICVLVFIGAPLNLVCSRNMTMKMFPVENQGFIQGVLSAISRLAMIGGPILISALLTKRTVYGAVLSAVCFSGIISLFACLNKIKKRIKVNQKEEKLKSMSRKRVS